MSKTIEHLYTLYNNPFFLSPIIVRFYQSYSGKQPNDLLLSYLILPIVLYEDSRLVLLRRKKDLRVYLNFARKVEVSKADNIEIKKNNKLFGLPDRVDEFKHLTNLSLQYAVDRGCLRINEDLSISFIRYDFPKDNTLIAFLKASEHMAIMLKREKLTHIYMKLGVRKL